MIRFVKRYFAIFFSGIKKENMARLTKVMLFNHCLLRVAKIMKGNNLYGGTRYYNLAAILLYKKINKKGP